MDCSCDSHKMHLCYLEQHAQEDRIRALTDKPVAQCRQCGARANSLANICAAHLKQDAPNVEGGHGSVCLDEIGKPHAG